MNYTKLTQEQRYQIGVLTKAGRFQVDIADLIGVHKSTISRELSRNQGSVATEQSKRIALLWSAGKPRSRLYSYSSIDLPLIVIPAKAGIHVLQ